MDERADVLIGQDEQLAMTPEECAEIILGKVTCDLDPEKGTWPYMNELQTRITALCIAAGIENADDATTVWNLVQRVAELRGVEIPETVAVLKPVLAQPLQGQVLDVMALAGFGLKGSLDQFIEGAIVPAFSPEQGAEYVRDELL